MPKRDWKKINEALVRRGELLLDLDFVKGWENELEAMNKDKEEAYSAIRTASFGSSSSCTSTSICLTASWKGSPEP